MKKIIVAVVTVLALAGGVAGLKIASSNESKQTRRSTQHAQVQQKSTEIHYKGVDGKDALDLLKQSHKVETKSYAGLGELVTGVDGVSAGSKYFWAFYVNGQQSQVGASEYVTKATDTIAWKLEEIK